MKKEETDGRQMKNHQLIWKWQFSQTNLLFQTESNTDIGSGTQRKNLPQTETKQPHWEITIQFMMLVTKLAPMSFNMVMTFCKNLQKMTKKCATRKTVVNSVQETEVL